MIGSRAEQEKHAPQPPNIVFIMTDQQHFRTPGCHGAAEVRTPNLDRPAAGGICFRNHFVTNPVCSPSRAGIFTGKYVTEHGPWANGCRLPDVLLFDVVEDPHELDDLAASRPDLVGRAMTFLEGWHGEMMRTAAHRIDPMRTVLAEGGPFHVRGQLPLYLRRLRRTGRSEWADRLASKHPTECRRRGSGPRPGRV